MITAYVTFNGNTEEAFNFYNSAIGGEITNIQRFGDAPNADQMSDDDKKKIMHIAMSGPYGTLMGNDHMDFMGGAFTTGNNFSLSIHPGDEAEADRLFNGLSKDGEVIVPISKAPWGDYFGMFIDKFGMKWMINCQAKR